MPRFTGMRDGAGAGCSGAGAGCAGTGGAGFNLALIASRW